MSTKIFLYCLPTGTGSGNVRGSTLGGDVLGYALTEDGRFLSSHLSSDANYSKYDMGLTSDLKRGVYAEACPDGFWLEWVDDPFTHEGVINALKLEDERRKVDLADLNAEREQIFRELGYESDK